MKNGVIRDFFCFFFFVFPSLPESIRTIKIVNNSYAKHYRPMLFYLFFFFCSGPTPRHRHFRISIILFNFTNYTVLLPIPIRIFPATFIYYFIFQNDFYLRNIRNILTLSFGFPPPPPWGRMWFDSPGCTWKMSNFSCSIMRDYRCSRSPG